MLFLILSDQSYLQTALHRNTVDASTINCPAFVYFQYFIEYKLNVLLTYLCLQAFSWSELIKFTFNFFSLFVSEANQSESAPSSSYSPVKMSAAPFAFLMTTNIMSVCLPPSSSWYLWWICLTYLMQCSPSITMRRPLLCVGLGLFDTSRIYFF